MLARSFAAKRIAGTYLFYGGEGTGRWPLFLSLAALVNCEQPSHDVESDLPTPCGECPNCRQIYALNFEGLHFAVPVPPHKKSDDVIDLTREVIEAKREEPFLILSGAGSRTIPIETARQIRRRLATRAGAGITRLVLFFQMENMLTASSDALLKMIEEPPADTIIVMTAHRPEALLPTVRSRAQTVRLGRIAETALADYLNQHYRIATERALLLARLSDGSIGAALNLSDSLDDEAGSWRATGFEIFRSLFDRSGADLIAQLTEQVNLKDRGEVVRLLEFWQSLIRDCTFFAVTGDEDGITNADLSSEIGKLAGRFRGAQPAARMTDDIKMTLADLRRNVHIPGAMAALALSLRVGAERV